MELELKTWSEFEGALQTIDAVRQERMAKTGRTLRDPLFRGVGSSQWGLETTLERFYQSERSDPNPSLLGYYREIGACKPAIETFSGKRWDRLLELPDFEQRIKDSLTSSLWLDMVLMKTPEIYEYLVYLRHHGFPSPLLDWSASPYVAAFFAFDSPPKEAARVAVYAFLQDTACGGSADAHLFVVGPYLRADPRHQLQQCRYSICAALDRRNIEWVFVPHQSGLTDAAGLEGELFTITMPVDARLAALKQLELMNINPFSLFASEDSLVRTIARRELLFRGRG
ncbi:MAG TPA: FRG domain-containing protein [Bryobacteraceae bacterium]|jgi:hypothetical protein|nr:FRG domain-containing protein [Bryobacteraceae bacterium]